jgi:Ca2+-binding RTX toxin-like protein
MWNSRAVLLASAVTSLLAPAVASASDVGVDPTSGVAVFATAPGETSNITVANVDGGDPFALSFADAGNTLTAGAGCTAGPPVVCVPGGGALGPDVELRLGPGDDAARALLGFGAPVVHGNAGEDTLTLGGQKVDADGGPGDDTIRASANQSSTLAGNAGDDALAARETAGELSGGPGRDLLAGAAGLNDLSGGEGNDTLIGLAGSPFGSGTMDGGPGNDLVAFGPENAVPWVIDTGAGSDEVVASGHGDTINTGSAPDVVDARNGVVDTINCGGSLDLVFADRADVLSGCELVSRSAPPFGDPRVAPAIARAQGLLDFSANS